MTVNWLGVGVMCVAPAHSATQNSLGSASCPNPTQIMSLSSASRSVPLDPCPTQMAASHPTQIIDSVLVKREGPRE